MDTPKISWKGIKFDFPTKGRGPGGFVFWSHLSWTIYNPFSLHQWNFLIQVRERERERETTCKFSINKYVHHITHAINCKSWMGSVILPKWHVFFRYVYSIKQLQSHSVTGITQSKRLIKELDWLFKPWKKNIKNPWKMISILNQILFFFLYLKAV